MQPREGGGGRRLLLSSGVDRLMLNGINANLQHLRRQSRPSSQPLTNGDVGQVKPETVQNGVGTKGPNKRLDYNRQAMREIGASIKGFHIDPNPNHVTSGSNGCSQSESFGRQEASRSGMTWCSNKNTDKVVEMVESLSNQETKYGGSQLFVPGYPNKVIRKPSFEEKYRTTTPVTSHNLSSNASPNYPMSNGYAQQYIDSSASSNPNSVAKFKVIRGGVCADGGLDVDGLGVGAGPGYFVPGRGPTFSSPGQLNGHVVPDPGPTQHRFTPRGRSPVHHMRPALRLVPGGSGLGSRNGSPGTVASSSSGSSPLSVLPPSVRQTTTHTFIHNPSLAQPQSYLVNDFVSRTPDEVSPLSSHSPSPASTPSSGYSQNVTDCQVGQGFTQPSQSTVMNTRQNFSKHLCNSKEVERPVPQKATVPPNPRVKASSSDLEKRLGLEFLVATKQSIYPVPRERTVDPSISINGSFLVAQDQQNFTLAESHRVAPAPVFYKQPFSHQKQIDVPSYRIQNDGFAIISNAQSQISLSTTFTVPPTNTDIPERPPPPYPGREVDITFCMRPGSAPNEIANRTLTQFNQDIAVDDALYCGAQGGYQNTDADYAPSEQYTDSTDGSSQTDTDGVVVEKQLIESPKPVRKADACKKDAERSETQVRHYPPQAYRFYMEQHMENIFKFRKERLERQMQLEKEMSQVNLPPETQAEIRKMLIQKESNYLRQRRAKIDKSMFQRLKTLGTGAFGEVDLVVKKDTNKLYALKTLQKKDVLKRNQVAHVKAERDILAEADNEWVVKLYYSFQDSANLYIVMDYIPGGDMMGLLIKCGIFEEQLAQFYIAELILAIESVHAMGFIHRDIKPDNILIDKDGHIKLTDFGLCTGFRWTHNSKYYQNGNHPRQDSMDPDENWCTKTSYDKEVKEILKPMERRKLKHQRCLAHSLVGTPNYIAPEVLCKSGYTACCDWWSVGVILYEMRVGQPPFLANNPADTQMKVINWPKTLSIPLEANLSPETSNLILRLCCGPEERLGKNGSSEVKSHPFFTGINFETLRQHEAPYIPPLRHPTDTSNFDPVDPDKLRRSSSRDSLLKEESYDGGKHAFFEFTFRRFFDDEGIAQATKMHDPESDTAIFV